VPQLAHLPKRWLQFAITCSHIRQAYRQMPGGHPYAARTRALVQSVTHQPLDSIVRLVWLQGDTHLRDVLRKANPHQVTLLTIVPLDCTSEEIDAARTLISQSYVRDRGVMVRLATPVSASQPTDLPPSDRLAMLAAGRALPPAPAIPWPTGKAVAAAISRVLDERPDLPTSPAPSQEGGEHPHD